MAVAVEGPYCGVWRRGWRLCEAFGLSVMGGPTGLQACEGPGAPIWDLRGALSSMGMESRVSREIQELTGCGGSQGWRLVDG